MFELEYAVLFAACWWYEASRYGRAVVLLQETINWLRERLHDLEIDPEGPSEVSDDDRSPVSFTYVSQRMQDARNVHHEYQNRVQFSSPLNRIYRMDTLSTATSLRDVYGATLLEVGLLQGQ